MGDRRKGDPVCPDPYLEELTQAAVDELSDEIGTGTVRTLTFVTLVAGTATYTLSLPSSIPSLLHLREIVNQTTGYPLEKKPLEFVLAMRVNNSDSRGEPRFWTLREDNAQAQVLELYPSPSEAGALDAYWSPVHRRVVAGSTYTTLAFSPTGLTALRLRVAGRALLGLTPESLARLSPPKSGAFAADLLAQSAELARAEFARLHLGETMDTVQRTR